MSSPYPFEYALITVLIRRTAHHAQRTINTQNDGPQKETSTTNLPITITSKLIDDAQATFDPSQIRRKLV